MADLSLDTVKTDTTLADQYLKKYNNFKEWPSGEKFWHIKKYPHNKVEYNLSSANISLRDKKQVNLKGGYLGRKLARKIEEHELLFAQLEYVIRKTSATDVKNNIKLISQHLQCSAPWNVNSAGSKGVRDPMEIIVNEKTPLYVLGCVAVTLYVPKQEAINLVTTKEMAPICHLFIELCAEIGWIIPLIFTNYIEVFKCPTNVQTGLVEEEACWCAGVVTESADIDSALDLFIHSSVKAPWRLKRVYVQESVYDEVRGALAWKCSRERVDSCVDAFAVNDKMFLFDSLGKGEGGAGRVAVEAYRTVKELCGLLKQDPAPCLSVWATDAALAHEIALLSPAARVWIDEYAAFDGPPPASLPFYFKLYPEIPCTLFESDVLNIKILSDPWEKLTKSDRVDVIVNVLQDQITAASSALELVEKLQDRMLNWRNDSFVSVSGGRICFGVEESPVPEDIIFVDVVDDKAVIDIINATINGSTVLYNLVSNSDVEIYQDVLDALENAGVPATELLGREPVNTSLIHVPVISTKLKVISTNFGTIFAN